MRRLALACLCALACLGLTNASSSPSRIAKPHTLSKAHTATSRVMNVRLLGALKLSPMKVNGFRISELSALAWDEDEQLLYAVSDNGWLFHMRPVLRNGRLVDLAVLGGFGLRDERGKRLRRKRGDSEGMSLSHERNAVRGDTRLTISFEHQPKVLDFAPDGSYIAQHELPPSLADVREYADPNNGMESLAMHPSLGVLTATEKPLRDFPDGMVPIFSLHDEHWYYALSDEPNSALVAIEALPDGSLLMLERAHTYFPPALTTILRRTEPIDGHSSAPLLTRDMAVLRRAQGWDIDNFEGLTRHQGMKFFMVSDNNNRSLQQTLLVYFELIE